MSAIKYHKDLTMDEVRTRTDEALKKTTYLDFRAAVKNIEGAPFDCEALVKEFRKMSQRPAHERSDFESTILMIVSRDLEAEIVNQGK